MCCMCLKETSNRDIAVDHVLFVLWKRHTFLCLYQTRSGGFGFCMSYLLIKDECHQNGILFNWQVTCMQMSSWLAYSIISPFPIYSFCYKLCSYLQFWSFSTSTVESRNAWQFESSSLFSRSVWCVIHRAYVLIWQKMWPQC